MKMKNSALLRWTNNKNTRNSQQNGGNKNWLHPPESLQKGHIAYLVKYLGSTPVDQPKGMEIVKEASRKLQFSQQLRKAEGTRMNKVELTVSVNGVTVQEPKTKQVLHQYALHHISFCADDKADKRFFSFIAKESGTETHTCFVFVSDKLSEEITLTIGQAFDLAYRRFLDTTGKEMELRRKLQELQNKLKATEEENEQLKQQLQNFTSVDLINTKDDSPPSTPSPSLLQPPTIPPRTSITNGGDVEDEDFNPRAQTTTSDDSFNLRATPTDDFDPRGSMGSPNDFNTSQQGDLDDDFDPRAPDNTSNDVFNNGGGLLDDFNPRSTEVVGNTRPNTLFPIEPPPRPSRPHETSKEFDPFTDETPTPPKTDDILSQFVEMKAGFSRGLSFATGDQDFTLDSLDPLKN